jgi:glycosyltransferase involved in cell wall biosynthesis
LGELHIVIFAIEHRDLAPKKIAPNVWVYPTNSKSKLNYIGDAIYIGKQILKNIYFGQTVITTQDPFESGIVGVFLKGASKFPLQVQLHTDAWDKHFMNHGILNWIRVNIIAPFVLKRVNGVRVVSEKIRRDVIQHGKLDPKIVSVLPIFVDVFYFANTPVVLDLHKKYPDWKTVILMTSRLTKEKNIHLALKVFRRIIKKYPDVGLVIVGDGPEKTKLINTVRRWKMEGNVSFEDWQHDLVSYFKTADIFLNTSLYEGYGMTLIEAGASGRSVVTTKVGVGYDFLEDGRNALVCPVGDEDCIYTKLVNILENPLIQKRLGAEIQKNILEKAVSKEEYLQKLKSLYVMSGDSR